MYQIIQIGDQSVPMKATAATQYRFKAVFGTDLMSVLSKAYRSQEAQGEVAELIPKLGYIMAKQADPDTDWGKLNNQSFMDWAEQFDSTAMDDALLPILGIYNANTKTTSTSKNRVGAPLGK